jgi:hypothetical protein
MIYKKPLDKLLEKQLIDFIETCCSNINFIKYEINIDKGEISLIYFLKQTNSDTFNNIKSIENILNAKHQLISSNQGIITSIYKFNK